MSSFARGMPPTQVWPPQSHGNVQLLTRRVLQLEEPVPELEGLARASEPIQI